MLRRSSNLFSSLCFIFLLLFAASMDLFAEEAVNAEKNEKKDLSYEELLQSLTSLPAVITRRDPFSKVGMPIPAIAAFYREDDAPNMSAPELERYASTQYKVIATLMGDVYARALVRTPEKKVLILREKDKLGNKRGIIKSITRSGIVLVESIPRPSGVIEKKTVSLPVEGSEGDKGDGNKK